MRQKVIWHILFGAVVIGLAHVLASYFSLYFIWRWYDIPMHILGGALIALIALWGWWLSGWFKIPRTKKWLWWGTLLSMLIVAVLWEVWEYVFGLTGNRNTTEQVIDTIKDLFDDIIGAVIVLWIYVPKILAEKKEQ